MGGGSTISLIHVSPLKCSAVFYEHAGAYTDMYVYICACGYIYTYVCIYIVYVGIYTHIYVYICPCGYICTYVCIWKRAMITKKIKINSFGMLKWDRLYNYYCCFSMNFLIIRKNVCSIKMEIYIDIDIY